MTERIFEVEISNKTSKGYETATALEMPATWAEFHDALEKARIKDARDCHNELTKIEYPGIQRGMIGDNVNLYELNLLAQRLAMLSEDDRMGLDGLLQIEGGRHIGPIPLPRLINLILQCGYLPLGAPCFQQSATWGAFVRGAGC